MRALVLMGERREIGLRGCIQSSGRNEKAHVGSNPTSSTADKKPARKEEAMFFCELCPFDCSRNVGEEIENCPNDGEPLIFIGDVSDDYMIVRFSERRKDRHVCMPPSFPDDPFDFRGSLVSPNETMP